MNNKDVICKAIDFIEANLKEELSVMDVSKEIGYSYHHFSRLFHGITGLPASEYILKRRLTEAADQLIHSRRKSIDISTEYQFTNYETFVRAFKRMFGITPSELRKQSFVYPLHRFSRLRQEDIRYRDTIRGIEPQIVERGEIRIVGLVAVVQQSAHPITEAWSRLFRETDLPASRHVPEKYYQLGFWPTNYEMNGFYVMCGLEVERITEIPLTMTAKTVPPAKYIRFIHKGLSRHVSFTYKYIYETWLPQSEYALTLPYEFEYYGSAYQGPDNEDSETEIYIPIKLI
ncbi:hypothetical protein QJ48_06360 [Paenibacillus sp. A3]|uniref:AraC family transcriptional regulator n=1 Tax=Paenibacillus sp. A3 TaxID=1337054 RepID=UPI0006D5788C|nr:AraC family transcriptional regulator [Paenibacillus sp. A3]KPV60300.1 hypothetical protein QJ48_06360 [Paenibacillus sp. A3]